MFNSFGSLSLLETGDDLSSVTGESTAGASGISGLDNEVEILFFSAGVRQKKTERNIHETKERRGIRRRRGGRRT